ncbi:MAG: hypothetical protein AAB036_00775 [Elusimicrobiota bacterium]
MFRLLATVTLWILYAFGFLLGGIFLGPLWALLLVVAVLVWGTSRLRPGLPSSHPFPALVYLAVLPVGLAGYLAPFRHWSLVLLSLPDWSMDESTAVGILQDERFEAFVAWSGVWFGACALIVGARWYWRFARQTSNLPTSRVRSLAPGLCELSGLARRVESAPDWCEKDTVMGFRAWTEDGNKGETILHIRGHTSQFHIEDAGGRVLVDPRAAVIPSEWPPIQFGRRICEIEITRRNEHPDSGGYRKWIADGDRVYLLGRAELREDAPEAAVDGERLVVRAPSPLGRFGSMVSVMLLGWGDPTVESFFFLTDRDEASARGRLRIAALWHCLLASFWIGSSLLHVDYRPPDHWRIPDFYAAPSKHWPMERLEAALDDIDPDRRLAALHVLLKKGLPPPLAARMAARDRVPHNRAEALGALVQLAPYMEQAAERALLISAGTQGLGDPDPEVQVSAIDILGSVKPMPDEVALLLASALKSPELSVRSRAADVFDRTPSGLEPVFAALSAAAASEVNPDFRKIFIWGVGKAHVSAERRLSALLPLLRVDDAASYAAEEISRLGPAACAAAAPLIAERLTDPNVHKKHLIRVLESSGRACEFRSSMEKAFGERGLYEGYRWELKSLLDSCAGKNKNP